MTTQIVNGVYQLKVPIPGSPLEATNAYLLQGDKSYTLIDTGWDSKTAFNSMNRHWLISALDLAILRKL